MINNIKKQRSTFSGSFGMIAATLGSAVGLGNIWMFPYQVGVSGGAGFLLIYLIATLLIGLPVMVAELSLGRSAHTDSVGVYLKYAPKKPWVMIAVFGLIATVLIMSFYTVVVGWVFSYVGKSATGALNSTDPSVFSTLFKQQITNPIASLGWQWGVLLLVGVVISLGVVRGIEATGKKLMPLLVILLMIIAVVSLMQPNAIEGVKFLFVPDWSKVNGGVILSAMGLAFFKLSIGTGTMTIYGSYFQDSQNIPRTAITVMIADLFVSLLAGLAIFPAVFAFGFNPSHGAALAFQTIPMVMGKMPLGHILLFIFFALTALASIGAMLSLVEVPIGALHERLNISRIRATWIVIITLLVLGIPSALSGSTMAHWTIFNKNPFDLADFLSSKIFMPLGGVGITLFTAYFWGKKAFFNANTYLGKLSSPRLLNIFYFLMLGITPLLIIIIMVYGLMSKSIN